MEQIENPMQMSYRESYAWQLGYNEGYKQATAKQIEDAWEESQNTEHGVKEKSK